LAKLLETILKQVLEAQATEALGAVLRERTEERQSYRNGYRERTLYTPVGVVLGVAGGSDIGGVGLSIWGASDYHRALEEGGGSGLAASF